MAGVGGRCGRAEILRVHGSNPKDGNSEAPPAPTKSTGAPGKSPSLNINPVGPINARSSGLEAPPSKGTVVVFRLLSLDLFILNTETTHVLFVLQGWRRFCRRRTRLTRLRLFKNACSSAKRGFETAKSAGPRARKPKPKISKTSHDCYVNAACADVGALLCDT